MPTSICLVLAKSQSSYLVEIEYLGLWSPPVLCLCPISVRQAGEVVVCASRVSITCAVLYDKTEDMSHERRSTVDCD